MDRARINRQAGSVLIGIVAMVLIVALATFAKTAMMDSERKLNKQLDGNAVLARLDTALANFAAKNQRLPCPAIGNTPSGTPGAGIEQYNATTGACTPANQIRGVVPWITLGLTEDEALDPWGHRITYRVDPSLTAIYASLPAPGPYNGMNMANCTSGAGAAAVNAQVNTLPAVTYRQCNSAVCSGAACTAANNVFGGAGKGLDVWNGVLPYAAPNHLNDRSAAVMTGAAYVLISHGPNGAGAYNPNGALLAGTGAIGNNETPNFNNQALTLPQSQATSFRDAQYDNTATAQHFDDLVSHPTIMTVLQNARLSPRQ